MFEFDKDFEAVSNVLAKNAETLDQLNRKVGNLMGKYTEDTKDYLNLEVYDRDLTIQKLEARLFTRDMLLFVAITVIAILIVM